MWPTMATKKAMNARSWSRIDAERRPWLNNAGHQRTIPDRSRATPPTTAAQKKNFWPALYLPTLGSSLSENFRYSNTLKRLSFLSNNMSLAQSTNISTRAAAKATPSHACSHRHTERPPNRKAIQPKTGDQMGMPVKRAPMKNTPTFHWPTRVEWRGADHLFPTRPSPPPV